MLRNYFKIALRNIKRYSVNSILNISGMSIGMACAILSLLWVQYELSYDRFRKNADNLFRVTQTENWGGKIHTEAGTPFPLAAALKAEYPEILQSTRYHNFPNSFIIGENSISGKLALVDKDFMEMFHIEFIHGDKKSALTGPNDAVITEEMAKRCFGDEDPIGKTIAVIKLKNVLTVRGVIKNIPHNSHFYSDCLASYEFYSTVYGGNPSGEMYADWNTVYNYTMIELVKGTDSKLVENKIKNFIQRKKQGSTAEIFLQNIKKIHLNSQKYEMDIATGNSVHVRLASLLAVLILIIACINFMNLATAQSSSRAKEIGVRKVAGANKRKIRVQFLGESLFIVFVAHIIAMILVELLLPGFKNFMFMEVSYQSPGLYLVLFAVILSCGLFAGSYPAWYLSSLKPTNILKGTIDKNTGNARFRRILVISQFTLSFIFIICTLIVRSQLNYIQNMDLGLNINNIGHFEFNDGIQRESLRNELGNNPDIVSVTITSHQNVLYNQTMGPLNWPGKKGNDILFGFLETDKDYAKTFQLAIKEGRFLSVNEFSANNPEAVINEIAAEIMGFKDPIGEIVTSTNGTKFTIVGVVKNFHFKTLHSAIEPLLIVPIQSSTVGGTCYIRMKPGQIASTLKIIRNFFHSYNLDYTLDFKLLDDDYVNMYPVEQIAGTLLGYITILAIIISCLGLIGLSTFMTLRRTKEIGIRKANGAKSGEIYSMLSKEYISLISISFLIASPVAWYATNMWLRSYAYRTSIGWWVFALAYIIVVFFTLATVGFQSYKAASRNPVESLRYE